MIVVSDTTAISCLLKLNKLHLLKLFAAEIYLPEAVWEELLRLEKAGFNLAVLRDDSWITVTEVKNSQLVTQLQKELDAGESEAIALALEKHPDFLLIDEKEGRAKANDLGIPTIGLIGVLLSLKNNHLLPAIKPILDELLNEAGFYLSESFYQKILDSVNE